MSASLRIDVPLDASPTDPAARQIVELPASVSVRLRFPSGTTQVVTNWIVQLGTRTEPAENLEVIDAPADARGVAEFRLRRMAEVVWVRCAPPEGSGWAMAVLDVNQDVDAESPLELELEFRRGGRLAGQVVDREGSGVAGARVHAFEFGSKPGIVDWRPSAIEALSDAGGRFQFPMLPAGSWVVVVEPGDWLQIEPSFDGYEPEGSWFLVEDGSVIDSLEFVVLRGAPFRVTVLDDDGAPVVGASVQLEPVLLLGGAMLGSEPEAPDPLEAFLAGESDRSPLDGRPWFPYGALDWTADARGTARVVGVQGTWNLRVHGPFAGAMRIGRTVERTIELPGTDLTLRLEGEFLACRGRFEDEHGRAVPGVAVDVALREEAYASSSVFAGADGRFEARWLEPGRSYDVLVDRQGFLPVRVPVTPTPPGAPEQLIVLREAVQPRLRFVAPDGEPLAGLDLQVLAVRPLEPRAEEQAAIDEILRRRGRQTNREGRTRLSGLPPGEFDLGVSREFARGGINELGFAAQVDGLGRPLTDSRVVRTWTLAVTADEQVLVLDASQWREPEAQPLPTHAGTVRDASTGAPVAHASVHVVGGSSQRVATTDSSGRFSSEGLPGIYEVVVVGAGYEPARLGPMEWTVEAHQHDLALGPGGGDLEITFLDRTGMGLPDVVVDVLDEHGRKLFVGERSDSGDSSWSTRLVARRGRVTILGAPRGMLRFELSLESHPLGACTLHFTGPRSTQRATVRLDGSLDEARAALRRRSGADGLHGR